VRLSRRCSEMGFDDGEAAAYLGDSANELEHIGGVQVIQNSQAKDDVEFSVLLFAEFADIVLHKLYIGQGHLALPGACDLEPLLSSFDPNYLSSARRHFEGVRAVSASEVQDAETGNRPACNIAGHLDDAPDDRVVIDRNSVDIHPSRSSRSS